MADEKSVPGLNADRPQSLLAYLLLHRHAPQPRQHIAFLLWPDSSESQARTNLRNLLYTLRHTLPDADTFLIVDNMTVRWNPDAPYDLDVASFEEALRKANKAENAVVAQDFLETAVALYRGDLLPGNYDDWIILLREEMRQQYLEALGMLVTILEEKGDYRSAIRFGQRLWQQEPLDEAVATQVMRLHALSGDRAGVQRVYRALAATLQRELDVAPAGTTQDAYAHLLRVETNLPLRTAAIGLPEWRPRPLPIPASPFIGREKELAEIAENLADPGCRLLTIVGLGGMGKTRLALQTAEGHRAVFRDGVAFASLTSLQAADFVMATIADALQFRYSGSTDPLEQVSTFLSTKEMLLVLDNFEHLLSAAEDSGANGAENKLIALLQAAPNLKLLVTSQQRLDLVEEWVYEIQGLALPNLAVEDMAVDNGAIALFLNSARRANSQFVLADKELDPVTRICQLVEGMPLGIELAASWVRVLTCAEIADEIAYSLDFLRAGARNMPPRHRSMHAVFDYSWQLLSNTEQQVLARLSVFCGAFSRHAAELVAGADLATLLTLVDKSLLYRVAPGRYKLHGLVRQYVATQLQEDREDSTETTRRHAYYYLELLREQETVLQSRQQCAAMAAITSDIDNIRAAWELAVVEGYMRPLHQAAFTLWYYYELRNQFREGKKRFAHAADVMQIRLAGVGSEEQSIRQRDLSVLLGELWTYQGCCMFHLGESQEALALTGASVELLRPLDEPRSRLYSLALHVILLRIVSSYEETILLAGEGLLLSLAYGQLWPESRFLVALGAAAHDQGKYSEAYDLLKQAMSICRVIGDPRSVAFVGNLLSRTAQTLARPAEVEALSLELLELTREVEDRLGMGMATEQLARAAQNNGNYEEARRLFSESVDLYYEIGDSFHLSQALNSLGYSQLQIADRIGARSAFIRACQVAEAMGVYEPALNALLGLAMLHAEADEIEQALELVHYVQFYPTENQEPKNRAEQLDAELSVKLLPAQMSCIESRIRERPFCVLLQELAVT